MTQVGFDAGLRKRRLLYSENLSIAPFSSVLVEPLLSEGWYLVVWEPTASGWTRFRFITYDETYSMQMQPDQSFFTQATDPCKMLYHAHGPQFEVEVYNTSGFTVSGTLKFYHLGDEPIEPIRQSLLYVETFRTVVNVGSTANFTVSAASPGVPRRVRAVVGNEIAANVWFSYNAGTGTQHNTPSDLTPIAKAANDVVTIERAILGDGLPELHVENTGAASALVDLTMYYLE